MRRRPNYLAGLGALLWLGLVGTPLYVMLGATVQSRADYSAGGPLSFPVPSPWTTTSRTSATASGSTS